MKAYKTFFTGRDKLESVMFDSACCITYEEGRKELAPDGSKLFVFESAEHAFNFISNAHHHEVWEVECGDSLKECRYIVQPLLVKWRFDFEVTRFWEHKVDLGAIAKHSIPNVSLSRSPEGTLACDWIIPIRKIVS